MIGVLLLSQIAVVAHAPDTAATCVPIEVTVAARVAGKVAPVIAPPLSSGTFQLLRSSVVARIEQDGSGQSSAIAEATFVIATDATGRVSLPPFVATAGSLRATATVPSVIVHQSSAVPPTVLVRAWLDRAGHATPSDTLFVGQQVDYVVDVQLNESARQRLRRNPTFFPPEMPGVLAYDLAPPVALSRIGHRCFETLSYRRALFPLFAGRAIIAPAALTYSLPLSTSFFSREESFELRTDSVRFVAEDVPVAGRPGDYSGAVGAIGASARIASAQSRMGDPVVFTLRLEGTGNVKLWPRPNLSLPWATIADAGERVQVDTSQARVRGSKEFDWLLTPRQAGRQQIPGLDYQYFDADRRAYAASRSAALSLDVVAALLAVVDSAPVLRLTVRRTLREELPAPLPTRPWFWVLLAVAPIPAAVRGVLARRRRRGGHLSAVRKLEQSAAGTEPVTARRVRRLFLDAVAERVPAVVGSTHGETFRRALRRAGVTERTAEVACTLFALLDEAAFSPAGAIDRDTLKAAATLAKAVDAEAVRPLRARGATVVAGAVLVVMSATLLLALPDGASSTFKQGVDAYDHATYSAAARAFARVAARAPRSVDAWANLGTTAWSRNDSAGAVRGWQRALRLDPLDAEVRERLDAVTPASIRAPGYVAPLPVNALAVAVGGLWTAAWIMLVVAPARRPRHGRALAGGSIVLAVVFLAGALEVRERLDPRGLGVLRSSRMLVDAPGSQTALSSAAAGETGTLGAREGQWVRIVLDGARAGWVPFTSVLPLDALPVDD